MIVVLKARTPAYGDAWYAWSDPERPAAEGSQYVGMICTYVEWASVIPVSDTSYQAAEPNGMLIGRQAIMVDEADARPWLWAY